MKNLLILILIMTLLPVTGYSQKRKKKKGTSIYVSTMLNYYQSVKPYSFESSYELSRDDLFLTFLTSNSGTFVIEDEETLFVTRRNTIEQPSQLIGFGASVQILQGNLFFHEISLTRLSVSKSKYYTNYTFRDSPEFEQRTVGYDQKTTAFAFRYEFGKYFGKEKAPLKFGLSASIEPSFYFNKRTPTVSSEFPIEAKLFILDMAIIPIISARLSKKVSVDFKMIPNVLIVQQGSVKEKNPSLVQNKQKGTSPYESPELSLGFNLLLRYQIKAPKKRRKRG